MNFLSLFQKLYEASSAGSVARTGEAVRKERAKGNATNLKAKDAARKRAERARQTPRERKPKQELIKEVIVVKTRSGKVQLIFKDSFNDDIHEKISKDVLTVDEAQQITKDPQFEQTRASKLLFGEVREKEPSEKKERKQEDGKKEERKEASKEEEGEGKKAKRMSKKDIFAAMGQMSPEQLAQVPPEMRDEYFKMMRNPPQNRDFDNLSYENLTVKFNISPVSSLPYNQQVMNALMLLAKMKAGASEQEIQTYSAISPAAMDFTRSAFLTARKVLSQIGDECIQNMMSSLEAGVQGVQEEGSVDMQCGNYKFKVSAGGELALSSTTFDQSNKSFKGLIGSALTQTLANKNLIASDPQMQQVMQMGQEAQLKYSTMLIPDEMIGNIKNNPELLKKLQSMKLKDGNGNDIGPVIDENGEPNPLALASNYRNEWLNVSKGLMKGSRSTGKSAFKSAVVENILKTYLRGDNIKDPKMAPNHLITVNGVFPMSDEYFNAVSKQADIDIKPAKDVINTSNISNYKSSSGDILKRFRTIVEEKEVSLKDILISSKDIDPMELIIGNILNNNDFDINVSLIPGMTPKDLNSVEFNYVKIGKKTIKIPVINNEKIANQVIEEGFVTLNDALLESLSNNFVLQNMVKAELLTDSEAAFIEASSNILIESVDGESPLKNLYDLIIERFADSPEKLVMFLDLQEKYKRNYKKEYRNYHGKRKQRKERAARTAARELMIKKGRVKKGDGKDIDHKKPLRKGGSKGINNLRVRDKSENRSDNGHKKGEKQNKDWK